LLPNSQPFLQQVFWKTPYISWKATHLSTLYFKIEGA
jgi:hypothetical protein